MHGEAEIEIRSALAEEAWAIADLVRRAFEAQCRLYDDWTLPPMRETAQDVLDAMDFGVVLAAIADGRLVGSVRGDPVAGDQATVEIARLAVEPEFQSRGIGRALVSAIESRFPEAERFEVFTGHLSERPLHLYESLGYHRVREEPEHEGLTLVYLEKRRPGPIE